MTASKRLARMLVLWTVLLAGIAVGPRGGVSDAVANDAIAVTSVRLEPSTDGEAWTLSGDFYIPLSSQLEDAVNRGVPLYFVVEFALTRPRWYWWDERTATATQTYRLAYHALTRQYRLTISGFQQMFPTLAEAVATMSRIRGWRVVAAESVDPGGTYDAQIRMRLDISQLPKPFQVTAITNRDWNPQAEWKRFSFSPQIARSVQ